MQSCCRFLSHLEKDKISKSANLRAHFNENRKNYLAYTNNVRDTMGNNPVFSTWDVIKAISDYIFSIAGVTQLYSLELSGFSASDLSGLYARLCWVYPNLDDNELRNMNLKK